MIILQGILEQGLIYGIIAMGVYITYRILDFPDLTVDGSFPLGAAVTAALISAFDVNPWLCLLASFLAGLLAGLLTGVIHVYANIKNLLSGILTMTALYSINLRISSRSNVPLFDKRTIFNTSVGGYLSEALPFFGAIIIIFIIVVFMKLLLDWYLSTKSGMLLRAAGDNPQLVSSLARDYGKVKILGLCLANALVALGGGVICQQQRFFDISMGTGTIVICLASVIIGLAIRKSVKRLAPTTAVILGAIIYKAGIAAAIAAGLRPSDMKFITAALFLFVLIFNNKVFSGVGKNG